LFLNQKFAKIFLNLEKRLIPGLMSPEKPVVIPITGALEEEKSRL
jgi:hypothetical protein